MLLQNQKIYIIRYLPTYLLKHSTNLLIPKKLKKFKQPITLLHTVILLPSHKKILQSLQENLICKFSALPTSTNTLQQIMPQFLHQKMDICLPQDGKLHKAILSTILAMTLLQRNLTPGYSNDTTILVTWSY